MQARQDVREIVIPAAALGALHRSVIEEAGAEPAANALRAAGRLASEAVVEELAFGDSGPGHIAEAAFWRRLSSFFARRGWGELALDTSHPGVGLLDAAAWADADEGSPYSEGLIAGILSAVVGADIHVLRLPSAGREDDVRFAFGSEITIRTLKARLSAASDHAAALEAL